MNHRYWLRTLPWVALLSAVACSGSTDKAGGSGASSGSSSGTSVGGTGSGSSSGDGVGSGSGASGAGGGTGSSTSGAATSGTLGGSGVSAGGTSGAASGTGGTSGAASGTATSGVSASGAGGSGTASGSTSGSSGVNPDAGMRMGMSVGCGKAPGTVGGTSFTKHTLTIPACPAGCTAAAGNCGRDCIAPEFAAPNGDQKFSYLSRDFFIELPTNYQPGTPYSVWYGGGGCGPNGGNDGWDVQGEKGNVILVGLDSTPSYCFADGGNTCSGSNSTTALCVNGPEVPYFRAVSDWVEANFCVDLSKEYIGGSSSGGWEAMTLGCAEAERLRGFYSVAGGKREHRWPCTGPIAGFMIVDTGDGANSILYNPIDQGLDSYGSQAERDELLARNGCLGTATTPATAPSTAYAAPYTSCLTYTGCPVDYPLVWCVLNGGHQNTQDAAKTNYLNAVYPFFKGLP